MDFPRHKLADILPAALAALLWFLLTASQPAWLSPSAWTHASICRQLLAGTTEGRQALFGSLWHAPLPALAGLPAAAIWPRDTTVLAGRVTAALAVCYLLVALWRACRRRLPRRWGPVVWLGFATLPCTRFLMGDPQLAVTCAAGAAALVKIADWCDGRRLPDLVKLAFALALLALCGGALAGLVAALLLCLPLTIVGDGALRRRFQGLMVLGVLPVVYALTVWGLMCRLILIDGFYPCRFAMQGRGLWLGWDRCGLAPAETLALVVSLGGAVAGAWRRRPAAVVLGLLGMTLAGWIVVLQACGLPWATAAASCVGQVTALLTAVALAPPASVPERPASGRGWALWPLALSLAFGALRAPTAPGAPAAARRARAQRETLDAVREFVVARTPYGRVFVCGYDGLALLDGYDHDLYVPVLDLHINSLREGYRGQDLFLLAPRPVGAAATECPVWRYGDIYEHGAARALYAGDWGDWRLYEIVTAPTAEQLREWRRPAPAPRPVPAADAPTR